MPKTVLITGANKGIGHETARRLGDLGYRVWLGARDALRGEAAAQTLRDLGHDVRAIDIAVDDDARVKAAAARVAQEDGKLDVLIANAGIPGSYAHPTGQSIDEIRHVYEVNVFGAIRLIQAFTPLLKAAGSATIVNVSSELGSLGSLSDPQGEFYGVNILGYNSSKTALNAVTVSFAKALAPFGIRVNSADPGHFFKGLAHILVTRLELGKGMHRLGSCIAPIEPLDAGRRRQQVQRWVLALGRSSGRFIPVMT